MTTAASTADADFFAPEVVADPYPLLEQIQAQGTVVHHAPMDMWMVLGFDEIRWCASRPELLNFPGQWLEEAYGAVTMHGCDDAETHDAIREVWAPAFHRTHVQTYRDFITPMIADVVGAFCDRVNAGEAVDVVPSVAKAIPTFVITELMGIDELRRAEYAAWSEDVARLPQAMIDTDPERAARTKARVDAARDAMVKALIGEIERRDGADTGDLIGRLGTVGATAAMTDHVRAANMTGIVFAGYETTAKLLGHCMETLARHPEQRRMLLEDRALIPRAVEEVLRYCGIVMMTPRFSTAPFELAGAQIPQGAHVALMFSAAGRDPERWPDPGRFDITREPRQHYAFGFGMHNCMGQSLSRLEAEIFLNEMLDRLPEWDVTGDVDYGTNFYIRGPERLTVVAR